nr:low temperature requirement protein A [Micromonospora tarapacensis]
MVIGMVFSGTDYSAERAAAFGVAFATSALLWRIYFHTRSSAGSPDPG